MNPIAYINKRIAAMTLDDYDSVGNQGLMFGSLFAGIEIGSLTSHWMQFSLFQRVIHLVIIVAGVTMAVVGFLMRRKVEKLRGQARVQAIQNELDESKARLKAMKEKYPFL
jgi:uncharacterized membrane protein (DUF106 family)